MLQLDTKLQPLSVCQTAWGKADWGSSVINTFDTNTMMCAASEHSCTAVLCCAYACGCCGELAGIPALRAACCTRPCRPPRPAAPAAENYPQAGWGFCAGDSGGPLILDNGSAAADRQIGIVSWGPAKCGQTESTPCERPCLCWRHAVAV